MRIGLDFRPAMMATTGIGRYVGSLSARLAPACDLRLFGVFRKGNRPAVRRAPPGAHLLAWPIPSRLMELFPADRALGGCDLFHHTNYWLTRVAKKTPQVMTLHDLGFLKEPKYYTGRAAEALARVVQDAVQRCAAFLVPSEATARDCRELLGIDRIFVTPLGVDPVPASEAGRYLLSLGTLEPRKNHLRVLRAFARLDTDCELHIVGREGWMCDDVLELAAKTPRVVVRGHLPEPELSRALAGAAALVYPSLLEGFGLPVLEANAAGVPALTSDLDPLRTDAALCIDPTDEEAIEDGMRRLLTDSALRDKLIRKGRARADEHSWERCARMTREAYEAVLA
ncbi:MAG: glycosyltransferase family 4 protein [Planctomycetota bacterium]|jgi:alpha-1,3-rhamnosyl/mannosyltransferase